MASKLENRPPATSGGSPVGRDGLAAVAQGPQDPFEVRWLARRKWALLVAASFCVTGIAFTFWWAPVVQHVPQWAYSGDLWDTYRAAQWVSWGNEGSVYQHGIYAIFFPGIEVLLAPVAMVATHYRLVNPYPYFVPKPTVLPILLPYVLAISVPALFVFDSSAEFLGVGRSRRILVCWMQGVLLWPVVVLWGHPEEALALSFAVLAIMASFKGKWGRAGWLLGFAIAFQPYALLLLPMLLGLTPKGHRLVTIGRSLLLSCTLLVLPLVQGWHATTHDLLLQPTYLRPNNATPLLALAPHLARGMYSAGVGRYLVALCALAAGWWAWRHRPGPLEIFWLAGLVFAVRFAVEPVVTPYYVWASAVFLLPVSGCHGRRRFVLTACAIAFASLWAYHRASPWEYWLPIVVILGLAVALARPDVETVGPAPPVMEPVAGPSGSPLP